MAATLYTIDTELEAAKASLLAQVHPRRAQTIHILAHNHEAQEGGLDALTAAREYIGFLGLQTDQLRYFSRIRRDEAERICIGAAEFDIIMSDRQMPHGTAASLAAAWLERFDGQTTFLTNGEPPQNSSRKVNFDRFQYSLFFTDREAGVLAISPAKLGIFWSAEDS